MSVDITCDKPASGAWPASPFTVKFTATASSGSDSCITTVPKQFTVTVDPQPTLSVDLTSTTPVCDNAINVDVEVAEFSVASSAAGSITLGLSGVPDGVTCFTEPPSPISGEHKALYWGSTRTPGLTTANILTADSKA